MSTDDYSVGELTPPALQELVDAMGGGMVQSVVFAAEVATADGERRFMAVWDNESSIANQLGLSRLLNMGIENRAACGWVTVDQEIADGN